MELKLQFLFICLSVSWILIFRIVGPIAKKIIYGEEAKSVTISNKELIIDIVFFSFAANGFYFFFFKILPFNIILDNIVPGFWTLVIWFGGLSFLGYLNLQKYLRWWIIAVSLYFVVVLGIMQFEASAADASINVMSQFINVFTGFMTVLFPAELGNLFRKIN